MRENLKNLGNGKVSAWESNCTYKPSLTQTLSHHSWESIQILKECFDSFQGDFSDQFPSQTTSQNSVIQFIFFITNPNCTRHFSKSITFLQLSVQQLNGETLQHELYMNSSYHEVKECGAAILSSETNLENSCADQWNAALLTILSVSKFLIVLIAKFVNTHHRCTDIVDFCLPI